MFARLRSIAVTSALVLAALSSSAFAQGPTLSLDWRGHHGSIGVTFGGGYSRPSYTAPCANVWVPGHYENRCERVWVAGCAREVWTPAVFEWRWDTCGHPYRVCVSVGRWTTVSDPGHYEMRDSRVWVAGRWQTG